MSSTNQQHFRIQAGPSNGNVFCNTCNKWFAHHYFASHLEGKRHKKSIQSIQLKEKIKQWQTTRTKPIEHSTYSSEDIQTLSMDNNLWYAQSCLICLVEVHISLWKQHINGKIHQMNFKNSARIITMKRVIVVPIQYSEQYFIRVLNYTSRTKVLVLGEQDFSYSVAICTLLQTGHNILATSYLAALDTNTPEDNSISTTDGERINYCRKTLPFCNGILQKNLNLLSEFEAQIAYKIDATNIYECICNANIYNSPFDIVTFPFPRTSLKRGVDVRNSLLIHGFFSEITKHRHQLLHKSSQIQIITLDKQLNEWDIATVAMDNGWTLKWRCSVNFASLPHYQPREVNGKAWKPKMASLLVFMWDDCLIK
eukprot:512131_1